MESEKARQRFDAEALTWDENPGRQALAKALFGVLSDTLPLTSNWTVLDYGSGTGLVTLPLASQVQSVMAVDMSQQMLAMLANKAAQLNLAVQTQQLNDQGDMRLVDPVDCLVSTMVLHHVPDIDTLLARFPAWLKPGGYVALADLEPEDGTFHSSLDTVHHHGIDPVELAAKMVRLGFEIVHQDRAHTVEKPNDQGQLRSFPVFLLVAQKPQ